MEYYSIDFGAGYPSISGAHLDIESFVRDLTDRQVSSIMQMDGLIPVGAEYIPMPLVRSDKPLWLYQAGIHYAMLNINNLTAHLNFYPDDKQAAEKLAAAHESLKRDYKSLITAFRAAENMTQSVRFEIEKQDRWPIQ